jgi:hypothetical protein
MTLAIVSFTLAGPVSGQTPTPVLTQHNNNARTGAYTTETILTPSNVNQSNFGKLFSYPVDGRIYAQPLYVPGVNIPGKGTHNVVFIETEHDSVYAFDADSNGGANATFLWRITLLDAAHGAAPNETTVPSGDVSSTDIVPEIGITSTPVIDLSTGTMYVVGKTVLAPNTFNQRLHALDITTGAEKFGGPKPISAQVPGTANGSMNGFLNFDPEWENQRAGLLLQNGVVYIAFGSHGDNGPWHGWIVSYNAATLQQLGAFCTTPNGSGSGIWMSGAGIAGEINDPVNHPYGRMFVSTGNGSFTATSPPYTNSMSYGDDIINLDLTNGVPTVQDSFTPSNQSTLSSGDMDVGSGGVLLLPDQTSGAYTHLLVQAGKAGTVYLVNRDNMGGFNSTTDNVIQETTLETTIAGTITNGGLWSTPAFWNNTLYTWPAQSCDRPCTEPFPLWAFSLTNGLLSTPPVPSGPTSIFPGATPSVSSNGTNNGIVWAITTDQYSAPGPAVLHAFNATNVGSELYNSSQNATRDTAGAANKFAVPTIANGKVYVSTAGELDVYGLAPQTASPVFSPASQSFSVSVSVTITDSTSGANIYYTKDGSTPATSAGGATFQYSGPIPVSTTETITAIAIAPGYLQSQPYSQTYTLTNQVAAPVLSPGTESFSSTPLYVTLSDSTSGASIFYTTNGSSPATSAGGVTAQYTAGQPIPVSATETIIAIATAPGMFTSNPASAIYTYAPGTGSDFANGFSSALSYMTFNGSTSSAPDLADSRLQLTNGGTYEASSAWFNTPVNIQSFTNTFTFQLSSASADGFTFTIQNAGLTALGGYGGGLGYGTDSCGATNGGIANSVAIKFDIYNNCGEGSDSTGLYTNGASPTTPAVDLSSSGINLASGDTFTVNMVYNGTTLTMTITDGVTLASYTYNWTVNIPQVVGKNTAYVGFTGGTGGLSASQKIETWTYTPGSSSSTPQTAAPTFSLAGGTYVGTQTVSLADSTNGATIYYTTDGSTPATSAGGTTVQYTAGQPIPVSTTETIKAVAIASGYSASTASSATYTIQNQVAAPTFSPPQGSYVGTQTVSLADSTNGATIFYTTDGSKPATSAVGTTVQYTPGQPIPVSATETINAIAAEGGYASNVSTAVYTISSGGAGGINFGSGFSAGGGMVLNPKAALNGTRLRLTDGGGYEASSAWYNAEQSVTSFNNNFSFQITPGSSNTADGFAFVIQAVGTSAIGPYGGSLGYGSASCGAPSGGIAQSVAIKFDLYSNCGEGVDSTGLYTNGASPTTPYVDLTSSGINLHSGDVFNVSMSYDGTNLTMTITDATTAATFTHTWPINIASTIGSSSAYIGFTGGTGGLTAIQEIISWTYTSGSSSPTAAAPTFSPAGGTYAAAQSVTLSDSTAGATIYYTTDGSTPATSAVGTTVQYTAGQPIPVSTTETISAIATAPGYSPSAVGSAVYTISLPAAATPTFSPAAGTYASTQSVTINDTTSNATIYYVINGSPTTNSPKYTGSAIQVAASETISAIATAPGYSPSAVGSAVYTVQSAAAMPTFSPPGGSYQGTQTVSLADSTNGATIFYTTDGSTPATSAVGTTVQYTGQPITVPATETIKAIATAPGLSNSAPATATYTIGSSSGIAFGNGFTSPAGLQLNGGSSLSGTHLRITDGGSYEARTAFWSTPVSIAAFTTDFTFQIGPGTSPTGDGFTFILQNTGSATAVGPYGGGLGYGSGACGAPSGGIANSLAIKFDLYSNCGEGVDSTGYYINGASPTTPAIDMTSSGVNLRSGDVMRAHITYNGTTLALTISDTVTGAAFSTNWTVNLPSVIGSSTAYVGFGGGTGAKTAVQDVITWTYHSSSAAPVTYSTASLPASSSGPAFSTLAYSGFPDGTGTLLSSAAAGDSVTFTVNVATPGIYDVMYSTQKNTNRGMNQFSINGSNTGPVTDQYNSAAAYALFDLGNFNFSTAGTYSFKFAVTGENSSSTGFTLAFDDIILTPQ